METNKLVEALAKARAEMPVLKFDRENPHFKSRYATLAAHLDCAVPALSKHGLAVTQTTRVTDAGHVILVTTLRHVSGGEISGEYPVVGDKPGPQPMGSALTYARRYTLAALLGLAGEEDDDGEAASKADEQERGGGRRPVAASPRPTSAANAAAGVATPASGNTTQAKPTTTTKATASAPATTGMTGTRTDHTTQPMTALVALGHEMVLAGVAMAGSAAEKKKERMRWCGEVLGKEVKDSGSLTDGDIHRCIQAAKKQAEARGQS